MSARETDKEEREQRRRGERKQKQKRRRRWRTEGRGGGGREKEGRGGKGELQSPSSVLPGERSLLIITLHLAVLSTGLLGNLDKGNAFLILLLNVSIKWAC